jgi:hypothetical protein
MKLLITLLLAFAVAAITAAPAPADAGVDVQVHIGLPVAPPLVVVQPGVSVVEDWDEEVFFVSPYYWVRRGDVWYRARSPRATFRVAPLRVVPATLVRMPPGQYVKYKKVKHDSGHDRRDRGDDHGRRKGNGHKHRDGHGDHDHGHRGGGHDDHGHRGGGHGKGKH